MTDRLKQLIALADGASNGLEWKRENIGKHYNVVETEADIICGQVTYSCQFVSDNHMDFIAAANPQTVKAMAELIQQTDEVLAMVASFKTNDIVKARISEALAAIQAFKENR